MKKVLLLSALAVFALAACKEEKGVVVAKVGGTQITDKMLAEKLQNTPPAYQNYVNTPLGRKQFIEAIVRENIMIESAKQAGVNKRSEYTEALADFKREQERQYNEYRDGLLIEAYLREVHTGITATDDDIEQYYNENKAIFDAPIEYTVKHILVTDKVEAEAAYVRIQNGENFDDVAKEVSEDTGSAMNGGLIGPFKRGDLVPEFEKAALELKNNELSGIVETSYGFHIIFKVSENILPPMSSEQAKNEIKRTLEKERFDKWFETATQKLGVSVDPVKSESVSITNNAPAPEFKTNEAVVGESLEI
ncbi:MAG: peptidylprolyl isomerase [Endomicrobium sp.]|jgi:parvulin-like peptidyl-prolyl isomerase|nr:peptidylprolyl isomerase [Endomicrobium sp.]